MRAEAHEDANAALDRYAARANSMPGSTPSGSFAKAIRSSRSSQLIEEDEDIAILVLAAGDRKGGTGPAGVAISARPRATFPIPVAIVPGHLTDEELEAVT